MGENKTSDLRELWRRYKRWQKNAFDYNFNKKDIHHCVNCGNDFAGNYCPHCSQMANMGSITWISVLKGAREVWGMHSRSLPYSIWQLIFRPGYFINDYINGKRQVSFPPVKMLMIMGVISVLIDRLFVLDNQITEVAQIGNSEFQFIDEYFNWLASSPGWGWLASTCFFILPTWAMFRYAPKNPRHTIPQGFFIQVFMSAMVMIVDNLADILTDWFYVMIPFCYIYANWQLFVYSYWGTIWRTLIVLISGLMLAGTTLYTYDLFMPSGNDNAHNLTGIAILLPANLALIAIYLLISRSIWYKRDRAKKQNPAEQQAAQPTAESVHDISEQQ